jgi:DNA-binding LacI/PurR family transcriptional regulator
MAAQLRISVPTLREACLRAARDGLIVVRHRQPMTVALGAAARARQLLTDARAARRHRRLAILIPSKYFPLTGAPFQARLAHEVSVAAAAAGYQPAIVPIPPGGRPEFAHQIIRGHDAAFVIEMQPENVIQVFAMTERRFPVLLFNRHVVGLSAPSLNTDDYSAAHTLARHFLDRGHRNLTLILPVQYESILGEHSVVDGWIDTLLEAGVARGCTMPIAYTRPHHALALFERLLRLRPRITAFVLNLPILLTDIITRHQWEHLRVPDDLSIAITGSIRGFLCPAWFPPITSFEIDWSRAGRCAVEMIDRMLAGESHPKDIRVPLNLQLTDSIGPAPAAARPDET